MSRTLNIIHDDYFDWICTLIFGPDWNERCQYKKLLRYLHEKEFTYTIDMDGNRAADGIDLRYQFACIYDYDNRSLISDYLEYERCSILEMMVALAIRCEEHIMFDLDKGDRTGKWFWEMIDSLGLSYMEDSEFDEVYVSKVTDIFLNRDYKPNGKGGLFTIRRCKQDLREVEIWYQMCWYLNDIQ